MQEDRFPVVQTQRLTLRRPKPEDFGRVYEMVSDPVAKRFTGGVTALGREARRAQHLAECALPFTAEAGEFAVVLREDDRYLGYCGFRRSDFLGGYEFLYGYCRDAWGRGYGGEAAAAALRYLFSALPHDRYLATADLENPATLHILTRLGFWRQGRIPDEDGEPVELYALDRADFTG